MVAARLGSGSGALLLALLLLVQGARADAPAEFQVSLQVDRERVVAHEQVVLTLRVEHPDQARASWEPPAFEGFWMERLATRTEAGSGEDRRVTSFRRALFPAYAGTLEIPTSLLVATRADGSDARLPVPGARVRVDPLPADPTGAETSVVGEMQLRATAADPRVRRGEAVELLLELWGEGNVWDAKLPDMAALVGTGVEVFPEHKRLFVGESAGRATTRWTLRFSLVAERTGRYAIPAISVRYFDPAQRAYREATSEPVGFEITEARSAPSEAPPWENPPGPVETRSLPWAWLLGAIALFGALSVLYLRRWQRRGFSRWQGSPLPSPRSAFENACQALGTERFAPLLSRAIKAGIHVRHHFDAAPLTTDEIAARIDDGEAIALLRRLDAQRFAGRDEPPEALLAEVRGYLRL